VEDEIFIVEIIDDDKIIEVSLQVHVKICMPVMFPAIRLI